MNETPPKRTVDSFQPSAQAVASAATWKRLAIQIAEEAQVVLTNAHWEVSYGSGDLRRTIKAVKRLQYTESETPPTWV